MANEDISKLRIERKRLLINSKGLKKTTYTAIAVLAAIILTAFYLSGILTPAIKIEALTVSQIYPSQTFTLLNASGYIVAQRKASVASKVTGRLVDLSVEEGSRVKKGEIIGRLENEDVIAISNQAAYNLKAAEFNLQQAQAELNDASTSFKRNQDLLKNGYISQAEYDMSEARYKRALAAKSSAEASVKAALSAYEVAKLNVEYTIIRAPFDGVILTKNADVGDIVTPIGAAANAKSALVTMADMGSLQAEVDVSESNIRLIKIGQPCEVQLDAIPENRFNGVVHMIVPTADRSKASVMVKIRFLDKDYRILPEMSVKVAFLKREVSAEEKTPITVINSSAIIDKEGKKVVFKIDNNKAKATEIKVGKSFGEVTEVVNGIKIGDRVVLKPLNKIKDGSRIKISEN